MASWTQFLIPNLVALALGELVRTFLASRSATANADREGWKRVAPSVTYWFAAINGTGLLVVFVYVRLFVGSARSDAAHQMTALSWLIAAFGIGMLVMVWHIRKILRESVQWRGLVLARNDGAGNRVEHRLSDIASISRTWNGYVRVDFGDRSNWKLDPYAQGVPELIKLMVEANRGRSIDKRVAN